MPSTFPNHLSVVMLLRSAYPICQLCCELRHDSTEVSTTSRAGCKNTECKRDGIKIQKGQLRYGAFITGPDWQSWAWKHW